MTDSIGFFQYFLERLLLRLNL
jgi:hypothetical protein